MIKKRITLSIPETIVAGLDKIMLELGMNRNALVNMVLKQYLDSQLLLKMVNPEDLTQEEAKKQLLLLSKMIQENITEN